ncbi:MAG TPA: tetratricopeptide repeat protein, partial [Acidobacteriaceae bacterium]|nr:tetratricopeptide repeat protein [Acidobacteriaceae bacterium]
MKAYQDGWKHQQQRSLAGIVVVGAVLAFSASAIAQQPATPANAVSATDAGSVNHADSYYHFALGHLYEDSAAEYGRTDMATQAIEQYKMAINSDPNAPFLQNSLANLYFRLGRIREAVSTAQQVLKQYPDNLDAHKLLGRVYLRSLGNPESSQPSTSMLHLAIDEFQKIVDLEPDKIENRLLLGQLYTLDHDMAKAQSQFQAAHKIDPNSEDVVLSLARLYSGQGDVQQAISVLNSVSPDDRTGKIELALGGSYDQLKDTKNAIVAYQAALDADPDNLDAQRGLAQDLLQTGKTDQALKLFQGISAEDPEDVQSFLRVAELEREKGHLDKSQKALEHAKAIEPDSVEVHYNQALLDEAQGNLNAAAEGLEQLVAASAKADGVYSDGEKNNRAIFLDRLATVYREGNKTEQAVGVYKKMIELGGDYAERGYQGEIDAYRIAKMWPEATAAAQAAVQAQPKSVDLKLTLAGQLADTGQVDQGLAMAKSQLNGTPQDRVVLLTLAQMYTRLSRWKDAANTLDQADKLSQKPEDQVFVLFLRGALAERQKHLDAAEVEFRKALAIAPDNALALNYLGYIMADHNMNLNEAIKLIQRAVQMDPQNGAYLDSLGWANLKMGQYALAEENLQRASELMPDDPTVHDHLGELYAKTGRLKQAITQWERSLQEYSHSAPADAEPSDVSKVEKKLESAKV